MKWCRYDFQIALNFLKITKTGLLVQTSYGYKGLFPRGKSGLDVQLTLQLLPRLRMRAWSYTSTLP
jgi:hypothetical protein